MANSQAALKLNVEIFINGFRRNKKKDFQAITYRISRGKTSICRNRKKSDKRCSPYSLLN